MPDGEGADTIVRVIGRLKSDAPQSPAAAAEADRVLRRLEPVARRTCRACAGNLPADRVEDLVQETLLVAWRRLPDFEPTLGPNGNRGALERWVKQIARFTCANARREHRETLTEDGVVDMADPAIGALAWLGREERDEVVRVAIERSLTGDEQDVVYHRHVHGMERAAIAELLGLQDANAVRVVLQRAHRRLQAGLFERLAEIGHGLSLWQEDFRA